MAATSSNTATSAYRLKKVSYKERTCHILLQNENGPCPLIAAANALILRGSLVFNPSTIRSNVISIDDLIHELANFALQRHGNTQGRRSADLEESAKMQLKQQERHVDEMMGLLPGLQYGLDVNPKFTQGPDGCEYTVGLTTFDVLGVDLVHGWLVDPRDVQLHDTLQSKSYNELVDWIIRGNDAHDEVEKLTRQLRKKVEEKEMKRLSLLESASSVVMTDGDWVDVTNEEVGGGGGGGGGGGENDDDDDKDGKKQEEEGGGVSEDDHPMALLPPEEEGTETAATTTGGGPPVSAVATSNDDDDNDDNITSEADAKTTTVDQQHPLQEEEGKGVTTNAGECDDTIDQTTTTTTTANDAPPSLIPEEPSDDNNNNTSKSSPSSSSGQEQQLEEEITSLQSKIASCQDLISRGHMIQMFLDDTGHQLTYYGLSQLHTFLSRGTLSVFFRNNHFSTILKNESDGKLYLLCTDLGYANVPDVIWECLDRIDGNTDYVDSMFQKAKPQVALQPTGPILNPEQVLSQKGQHDLDYQLAMRLQNGGNGGTVGSSTSVAMDEEEAALVAAATEASLSTYHNHQTAGVVGGVGGSGVGGVGTMVSLPPPKTGSSSVTDTTASSTSDSSNTNPSAPPSEGQQTTTTPEVEDADRAMAMALQAQFENDEQASLALARQLHEEEQRRVQQAQQQRQQQSTTGAPSLRTSNPYGGGARAGQQQQQGGRRTTAATATTNSSSDRNCVIS